MISSFLLQDIPRNPDTRLFEVREAFNTVCYLVFRRIFAHISQFASPVALRATDAEPLINALFYRISLPANTPAD